MSGGELVSGERYNSGVVVVGFVHLFAIDKQLIFKKQMLVQVHS